ncbi:hypothetical protein JTB14_002692 [Gonioctena quinquepunctata]|nr:hypothetical protein JTB14_002692 [Gonioctena quinquepunctata]
MSKFHRVIITSYHYFACAIGLPLPHWADSNYKPCRLIYHAILCLIQIIALIATTLSKVYKDDFQIRPIHLSFDIFITIAVTITNIIAIVVAVVKEKDIEDLNKEIREVENTMKRTLAKYCMYKETDLALFILVIETFVVTLATFDIVCINVPLQVVHQCALWYANNIITSIVLIQIYSYVVHIFHLLKYLNRALSDSINTNVLELRNLDVRFFQRTHERISNIIGMINKLFGVQILGLVATMLILGVRCLYVPLKLKHDEKIADYIINSINVSCLMDSVMFLVS